MTGPLLLLGDCVEKMRELEDASIDAVVCDPPYGLGFMGKKWDEPGTFFERRAETKNDFDHVGGNHNPADSADSARTRLSEGRKMQEWCETWAAEALRVLKPGGHLLAFGGTRTYHRLACAVEDAGFEIRDTVAWFYGSGFPKSHNVAKAIDRKLGVAGEYAGVRPGHEDFVERTDEHAAGGRSDGWSRPWQDDPDARERHHLDYEPGSPEARAYAGWGTALKPAFEPVVVARKPLEGTVAENVLAYGVGGLNIDATRIEFAGEADEESAFPGGATTSHSPGSLAGPGDAQDAERVAFAAGRAPGRWPANVALGHTDECVPVGEPVASSGHYPAARPGGVEIGTTGHAGQDDLEERHTAGEVVEVWECVPGCPVRLLDEQTGTLPTPGVSTSRGTSGAGWGFAAGYDVRLYGDSGGASRFFYVAKATNADAILEHGYGCRCVGEETLAWECAPECPVRLLDEQSGTSRSSGGVNDGGLGGHVYGSAPGVIPANAGGLGDWGGASRFFYTAKASRAERNAGLDGFDEQPLRWSSGTQNPGSFQSEGTKKAARNHHPTVKPVSLMRWLVRLVTPPGGTVLDPFLGSGTTGIAAALEGMRFVGIEKDPDYLAVAEARIRFWAEYGDDALRIVAERDLGERRRVELADAGQLDLFG